MSVTLLDITVGTDDFRAALAAWQARLPAGVTLLAASEAMGVEVVEPGDQS